MAGKQAKRLSVQELKMVLAALTGGLTRYPERDTLMVLLSFKAGLRAKEIASLTWSMVTDSSGELVAEITLPDSAAKGRSGRPIPIHKDLAVALEAIKASHPDPRPNRCVIHSERSGNGLSPNAVAHFFRNLYASLGLHGASSHSGRRTFVTNVARVISKAGGSMKDVQGLAGHASMATTQLYVDESEQAKKSAIDMI